MYKSQMSSAMEADQMESGVPPGFRFHPTEEELVGYYLHRKIKSMEIDLDVIAEIDLYKMEPWDIQGRCKLGYEEQSEWYFFSHKDKKYPTGTRTNRATAAGFWKATGRDKAVLSKNKVIGMRKTLVFYRGRAPNGRKSDWIMHEYRLQTPEPGPPQDGEWVVCRAFKKPSPNQRQGFEAWNHAYYVKDYNTNFFRSPSNNVPSTASPSDQQEISNFHGEFGLENEQILPNHPFLDNQQLLELPQLSTDDHEDNEGISNASDSRQFVDWKECGNSVASNSGFMTGDFSLELEADHRNHIDYFLGYFPDS